VVRQRSFALKGRRKQQFKEILGPGGVAEVIECLPRKLRL
jgi:hypothetical protein